ncbi:MAG: DUF2199 domain-containing protein [Gemmataceae bacterium]
MSDKKLTVSCDCHGESYATFVCKHLAKGFGLGFFCADQPGDPQPDAWCGACQRVLEKEGVWNDRSESFADVKLVCAGCYTTIKDRNLPPAKFDLQRGFTCRSCGKHHKQTPMDFGFERPSYYYSIPKSQRKKRCSLTSDLCVVDNEYFFIRGCLEIPVWGLPKPFVWGVWTSLSQANYKRTLAVWNKSTRVKEPPYFGWLSSLLPPDLYPDTLQLKTMVHTRKLKERPLVILESTDHPLAVEQREGMTLKRLKTVVGAILHL